MVYRSFSSPVGWLLIGADEEGICGATSIFSHWKHNTDENRSCSRLL